MPCQSICPNPRCRKILSLPEEARGSQVQCQHCRTIFCVPELKRETTSARRGGTATGEKR
jgi:hypothetical protein